MDKKQETRTWEELAEINEKDVKAFHKKMRRFILTLIFLIIIYSVIMALKPYGINII